MKGFNIIGKRISAQGPSDLDSYNPTLMRNEGDSYHSATTEEAEEALQKAQAAASEYRQWTGKQKALLLRTIAQNIEELGTALVDMVMAESGLPKGRVEGERGRTCNQLRFFADKVEEGSWVNAIIDHQANTRQYLDSLGPVLVFTASNFPLAFSTAGGDTASALAAGCPVIVKAHESHLGTNQMIAEAIRAAVIETGAPDGTFSSLNAKGYELGKYLIEHDTISAIAFTGSLKGGTSIYQLAQNRRNPIPVFAEMGSVNPVTIFQSAVEKSDQWAQAVAQSINMGAGQFCTNPGILLIEEGPSYDHFIDRLVEEFSSVVPATMLNPGICKNYNHKKAHATKHDTTRIKYESIFSTESLVGNPCLLEIDAEDFLSQPELKEEIFGPLSIIVKCKGAKELKQVLSYMDGQLTYSFLGEEAEIIENKSLLDIAKSKAGRIVINALPTGVAVNSSMHHGGPFPSTTDARFTSVGGNAIYRFVRPICLQGFSEAMLPDALKDSNPLGIWRMVDGQFTKE